MFVIVLALFTTVYLCLWNPRTGKRPSGWARTTLAIVFAGLICATYVAVTFESESPIANRVNKTSSVVWFPA
jgi:hypothetical protein